MIININDLKLPDYHPWFLPCDKTVEELIQEGVELSKDNWIVKSVFGYTLLSNEDSSSILKNPKWHNAVKMFLSQNNDDSDVYKQRTGVLISLEGDEHYRLKKLVMPYFTPSATFKMKKTIHDMVNQMIQPYVNTESFDIQKEYFNKIPAMAICKMLGVPLEDIDKFLEWTDKVFLNVGIVDKELSKEINSITSEFINYIINLISIKRLDLKDDLISDLIRSNDNNDFLSDDEIIMLVRVILASGIDTGRGQLGLSFKMFANDKETWKNLSKDDDLLKKMVDKSFRLDGVIKNLGRFASEDIVYRGILFPKGTLVFPSISVPNIQEQNSPALTFGRGIHYCLGASLASVIVEETMLCLSKTFPDISISNDMIYKDSHRSSAGLVSMIVNGNRK
jgi:cytochrome P450